MRQWKNRVDQNCKDLSPHAFVEFATSNDFCISLIGVFRKLILESDHMRVKRGVLISILLCAFRCLCLSGVFVCFVDRLSRLLKIRSTNHTKYANAPLTVPLAAQVLRLAATV